MEELIIVVVTGEWLIYAGNNSCEVVICIHSAVNVQPIIPRKITH